MEVETESVTTKYVKRSGKFPGDLARSVGLSRSDRRRRARRGEWDNEKEERTERNELLRQIYCVVPPSLRPSVPLNRQNGMFKEWMLGNVESGGKEGRRRLSRLHSLCGGER